MKMRLNLLLISFFVVGLTFAQEAPKVKYGKPSPEDLQMKLYAADSTAEAVILFDDGASVVSYDLLKTRFTLRFTRFIRLKILKQEGTSWGNFLIPLYSNNSVREDLVDVDGFTFNLEDGKTEKAELKKESIFRERENKYWEVVKLSLPKVKVGSVIDLRYEVTSPLIRNLRTWKFQYTIPVKWSQYEVTYPEYYSYSQSSLGYHSLCLNKHTTKNENINISTTKVSQGAGYSTAPGRESVYQTISYIAHIFNYAAKDVAALKEEPYVTTLENYTTRVKFELASTDFSKVNGDIKNYTTTWTDIVNQLLNDEDFGLQIKGDNFAEDIVEKLVAGKTNEKDKIMAIYDHIRQTMKWNKTNAVYCSKSLRKSYTEKNGNSADVNLILLAMLRKAGIDANPVLLSTRQHGILNPTSPTLTDFNYVVIQAMVDNNPMLLDATELNIPAGSIPFRCLNGHGILIKKDDPEEVELKNPESRINTTVLAEFTDGQLTGKLITRLVGESAYDFREAVKNAGGPKDYFEKMKNNSTELQYVGYSYTNLDSTHLSADKVYDFKLENSTAGDNSMLYINPILSERLMKNPFTSPTREFPVDFGSTFSSVYMFNLKIPEGYQVEELPKSKTFMMGDKDGTFTYQVAQNLGMISISTRLKFIKSLFLPDEYENLRMFYDMVVAKESEQIILKKTN